jgi:putative restriction endonuclease
MCDEKCNHLLQTHLLETYFPRTKQNVLTTYTQKHLFDDLDGKVLYENAELYRTEMKQLVANKNEEEVFIRGGLFKREIPKLYNYTCCISGLRVEAIANISMVDACHIVPFAESYDDTIKNGIALCPTLHRAFDRGLIGIDDDYKVILNANFKESEVSYSIKQFIGESILLPQNPEYYPSIENLRKQRGSSL